MRSPFKNLLARVAQIRIYNFHPDALPALYYIAVRRPEASKHEQDKAVSSSLSLSTERAGFIIPTANTARAGTPLFLMQIAAGTTGETVLFGLRTLLEIPCR
jgi:hypothetical protein